MLCTLPDFSWAGCFAMTELKHGSNVAGLQTEAILDVRTDEWVVNVSETWLRAATAACVWDAGVTLLCLHVQSQDG